MPSSNTQSIRFALLCSLLVGCAQPVLQPPQGGQPLATATAMPTTATVSLPAVPADLRGDWIETRQAFAPAQGENFSTFKTSLLAQLQTGSLPLPEAGTSGEGKPPKYPDAAFYNGRAPVLSLSEHSQGWIDFRGPIPGAAPAPQLYLGFDGSKIVIPPTTNNLGYSYYVSKAHDQLVYIGPEADFNGLITVYLREADAKARYGMCLDPSVGNAISCEQL